MPLINTTKGEMDEALLQKREGTVDDDVELTTWVEHWLGGKKACEHAHDHDDPERKCTKGCGAELVHRSVSMKLKKAAVFAEPQVASFK